MLRILVQIIVYGFFGWLLENMYNLVVNGSFFKPNFLYLPIKPMYGIAGYLLAMCKKTSCKLFVFLAVIISLCVEFITGFTMRGVFNLNYWDYSNEKFNYKGLICLKFGFFWSILAYLFVKFVEPKISALYNYSKDKFKRHYCVLCLFFVLDCIISVKRRL